MKFRNLFKGFLHGLIVCALAATMVYAFTRDWDNTDPIDHTLNSKWPAEIREVMVDVAERLDSWVYGFTSGETDEGVKRVPMIVQGSDPGATANTAYIYSKDVSSTAEVFIQDEAGNAIQVTSSGALNVASACSTIYPVGSIYIATVSTNPNTLLGCGTWTAFAAGRVMVGVGTSDQAFSAGATGGESTHLLTSSESGLKAHTHIQNINNSGGGSGAIVTYVSNQGVTPSDSSTASNTASDASSAHNNLQPYIVVYMWERTA